MERNVNALVQRIEGIVEWAETAETQCSDLISTPRRVADDPHEELIDAEGRLAEYTRRIYRELRLLAGALNVPEMSTEIRQVEERYGDLTAMEQDSEVPVLWSPALREALILFASLQSLAGTDTLQALNVFHNMLDKTGRIIEHLDLVPSNETQVRNVILRTVKYAFPDARKEQHAPNNITNFRMDIAVPSLKAVAEYKFADSADAVQECLNGIYADMTGYGGNAEWKHFFAVIYMTGPYRTPREVEQEFERVRARANWTPVVVVGPGERIKRRANRRDDETAA